MAAAPRVDPDRLIDFAAAVYASAGMPAADARLVADTLVQADLWGHQSHGVLRLGWYRDRILNRGVPAARGIQCAHGTIRGRDQGRADRQGLR